MIRGLPSLCLAAALTLGGCGGGGTDWMPEEGNVSTRAAAPASVLPPMKVFRETRTDPPRRANADMARDFMDLTFQLESGRELPVFTRFEAPVRVSVSGEAPPGLVRELDALIARIRREAGIDIARLAPGQTGNVVIEPVSGDRIRGELPQAACFVVPNIKRLSQFRIARRQAKTDWTALRSRQRLAIFVPDDVPPQEMRDCLHEEMAQALGPLNDLYRLPDSTFNDDNVHSVLTGFDMLMLRVTYAPELRSGMNRAEVAAALPGVLDRLNPAGRNVPPNPQAPTTRGWKDAIGAALGAGAPMPTREQAAGRAVAIAQAEGWQDHRLAFSHYVLARLTQVRDPDTARQHLKQAHALYRSRPDTQLHAAQVAAQLAAHAITRGDGDLAINLLNGQDRLAETAQNASLLASILMLRAEALDLAGRDTEARSVRLDSLGWARYGFGPDWAVRAKLQEMAALNPTKTGG